MRLGLTLLRTTIGLLFVGHGTQKLFGWFGGHGPEGTGGFFESLGLRPGRRNALAAGGSETVGGALLAAGLLTPVAAGLLSGTMITAIRTVHGTKGPWNTEGGWEYNAVLLGALFALADAGPGRWSADERLGLRLKGPGWAIGELGAAVAGSAAVMASARPEEEAAPPPEREAGEPDEPRFSREPQEISR